MLLSRKASTRHEQRHYLPRFQKAARSRAVRRGHALLHFGLVAYGNMLMPPSPHQGQARSRPSLHPGHGARARLAFENPQEAAAISPESCTRGGPEFSKEELLARALAWSEEAKANGLGAISREKMTSTRDVVHPALSSSGDPVEALYRCSSCLSALTLPARHEPETAVPALIGLEGCDEAGHEPGRRLITAVEGIRPRDPGRSVRDRVGASGCGKSTLLKLSAPSAAREGACSG